MALRDHEPIIIEDFGGWWDRGDDETCPTDHFTKAENVQYPESAIETRYPVDIYQLASIINSKVIRVYDYVTQTGQTLLVLVEGGIIHHVINENVVHNAILTIAAMEDFGFVAIAGRAYITPFHTLTDNNGQNYELGLPGEFVYVYAGDGTPARKTGGQVPSNANLTYPHVPPSVSPENPPYPKGEPPFIGFNDINDGLVTRGVHKIGISFDSQNMGPVSDYAPYSPPPFDNHSMFPVVNAPGGLRIQLNNIPIGPPGTTRRFINMSKAVDPNNYNYNDPHSGAYFIVAILLENTSTTYLINMSDDQLVTQFVPTLNSPYFFSHAMMPVNSSTQGFCEPGFHLVGVVFETNTGYLSSPGPEYYGGNTNIDPTKKVMILNIPLSTDPTVVKRHLVSTKTIPYYNGDQKGYQFYFIPGGTIEDNTTRATEVSYYDSDLLADASHLMDNFVHIPAGVALTTYHSRLVVVGDATIPDAATLLLSKRRKRGARSGSERVDNRSVAWVSAPGEPEAISQVDGIIIVPLDGNPLTNCQEFRDGLYLYKKTRTYSYIDNLDEPATWQEKVVDEGIGTSVHGIAAVLDSGGVNADFLLVYNLAGLMLFNGVYSRPELSWKIEDFWLSINRNGLRQIQLVNDSLAKRIYMTLPDPFQRFMLYADYSHGLDTKNIAWSKWKFDTDITAACLMNTNKLILGAELPYSGIYFINLFKTLRHDTYNGGIELKIPDPTIRTALLGE